MNDLNINQYFDKIYIINLERRNDKWEILEKRLFKNNITNYIKFTAIDGYNEPYKSTFYKLPITLESPGAYGLLLTIYNILLDAIKNNYKNILLLEDDVIFCKDFNNVFNHIIKNIPDSWKLLYLGSSIHTWRFREKCKMHNNKHYCIPKGSVAGAFAIAIHNSIFNELLYYIKSTFLPWDIGPLKLINLKYYGNVYIITPNIIIADVRTSDIREKKDLNTKANKCNWDLKLYDF